MSLRVALVAFLSFLVFTFVSSGQSYSQTPGEQKQASSRPPQSGLPDEFRLNIMIRNTVIALNQANQTGNYSVLRDLGTPAFQIANNQAKLAEIFSTLRNRKLDLSPIILINPKLVNAPSIQDGQILRLTGFFPTTPEQVNFDLAFQIFSEQWMLAGLAVSTVPASEVQRPAQASPLQSPSGAASGGRSGADGATGERANSAEGRANRIDLSDPSLPPKRPAAERKPKPAAPPAASTQPKPQAQTSTEASAPPRPRSSNAAADQPAQPQ